jgi:hypothetical protein
MSEKTASIKGSLLSTAITKLMEYATSGILEEQDVEAALGDEYADLVTPDRVGIGFWYPAELYDRLLTLMMERVGHGKPEYLAQQGREAAATLVDSGIYIQLGLEGALSRGLVRTMLTLSNSMYNFTTWEMGAGEPAEGWFEIIISDAARYPESFRWRNEGFIEAITERASGRPWRVTSERSTRDRIVLTARARS